MMLHRAGRIAGRTVLFEAGAAIIFFGSLMHQPELIGYAAQALHELRLRGYEIPTAADPVRAYPVATTGAFSPRHAGGWRPGVISLRQAPQGTADIAFYLRHELMHEASFRSCKGKLPLWAEEAAAISFSMEAPLAHDHPSGLSAAAEPHGATVAAVGLAGPGCPGQPTAFELESLRQRVRVGAGLDSESYQTLTMLVSCYGWPANACARSESLEKLLQPPPPARETGFSYILVSLLSGRVLESQGDLGTRYAPGSLLKIPYAAALGKTGEVGSSCVGGNRGEGPCKAAPASLSGTDGVPPHELGIELARSDTAGLLARKDAFDLERFRFLIAPVKDSALSRNIPQEELSGKDEKFWRRYLGERGEDGNFPLTANLPELAQVLRASLLYRPTYFTGLSRNGFLEGSTLSAEPPRHRRILGRLHAMTKTGTVADARGTPLTGHLMVAWPAADPLFLALFRTIGGNGAANLRHAAKLLEKWADEFPSRFAKVRVRLLTRVPRASWEVLDECPTFESDTVTGVKKRISTCGRFRIVSRARGSRPERLVAGILARSRDGRTVVLETDAETYADAVLTAEAQELQGEARKALRAVIVWNGAHGRSRHEDSSSLCDTTHCMVFQGSLPEAKSERGKHTDPRLLRLIDELATRKKLDWLPFSKGGNQPWERKIAAADVAELVNEPSILDLRRQRTRNGEVVIHLMYPDNEEIVSCEVFRNRLKLLSCPETIHYDASQGTWVFSGIGEGHGEGLSLARASALARAGYSAATILNDACR